MYIYVGCFAGNQCEIFESVLYTDNKHYHGL